MKGNKLITAARAAKRMTRTQLAEKAGLSMTTIKDVEVGRIWGHLPTVRRISNALEIPMPLFYTEEGFIDPELRKYLQEYAARWLANEFSRD